jgi:hypothetical protein
MQWSHLWYRCRARKSVACQIGRSSLIRCEGITMMLWGLKNVWAEFTSLAVFYCNYSSRKFRTFPLWLSAHNSTIRVNYYREYALVWTGPVDLLKSHKIQRKNWSMLSSVLSCLLVYWLCSIFIPCLLCISEFFFL